MTQSEKVFTLLAGEDFIERMTKETMMIYSGSQHYRGIFWLSTVKNPSLSINKCKPGHEFEILTEGSQYAVLPPSIINGHHYQSIGKEKLTISAVVDWWLTALHLKNRLSRLLERGFSQS